MGGSTIDTKVVEVVACDALTQLSWKNHKPSLIITNSLLMGPGAPKALEPTAAQRGAKCEVKSEEKRTRELPRRWPADL